MKSGDSVVLFIRRGEFISIFLAVGDNIDDIFIDCFVGRLSRANVEIYRGSWYSRLRDRLIVGLGLPNWMFFARLDFYISVWNRLR